MATYLQINRVCQDARLEDFLRFAARQRAGDALFEPTFMLLLNEYVDRAIASPPVVDEDEDD